MSSSEHHRAVLWAALAFVGLLLAGSMAVPTPPGVADGGRAVVAFYREHSHGVALQAWLTMAASVPAAALVALVVQRMSTAARSAFLMAAAITVSVLAVGLLLRLGLALHPAGLDPGTARSIADIEAYWAPLLTFPIITQAAAIIFAVRAGDFAGWLAAVSGVLLVEQLIESVSIFGHHGFLAPGGDMNSLLGPALYGIWLICLGVAASKSSPQEVSATPARSGVAVPAPIV